MKAIPPEFRYPRRRLIRNVLRQMIRAAFAVITDLEIVDRENFPERGPLILVGNHFSFIDPVAMIHAAPWLVEFVGGFRMPNAPPIVTWIPRVWGRFPIFRGTGSRHALRGAEAVLEQRGVLGIFPEGGSWATVLRPARPFWLRGRGRRSCRWGLMAWSTYFRVCAEDGVLTLRFGSASRLAPFAQRVGDGSVADSWRRSVTRS